MVPTATNIEVLMESRLSNNLVTLTAPVNKDAKNLFKWPNNFAWTYNGGVAAILDVLWRRVTISALALEEAKL